MAIPYLTMVLNWSTSSTFPHCHTLRMLLLQDIGHDLCQMSLITVRCHSHRQLSDVTVTITITSLRSNFCNGHMERAQRCTKLPADRLQFSSLEVVQCSTPLGGPAGAPAADTEYLHSNRRQCGQSLYSTLQDRTYHGQQQTNKMLLSKRHHDESDFDSLSSLSLRLALQSSPCGRLAILKKHTILIKINFFAPFPDGLLLLS